MLSRYGFDLAPAASLYDWQVEGVVSSETEVFLPQGAERYLRSDNPILMDLSNRYQESDYPSHEILLWTEDRVSDKDMLYFRGHNAYLYQEGKFNRNILGYLLAYYYAKSLDDEHLLDKLREDNSFGAITFEIDGKKVSRDLLDSVLEIYFLDRNLDLFARENLRVLDIGAGYGRLAHRMAQSLPNLGMVYCTDAIPVSSFLADYYLKFRKVDEKAQVILLNEIKAKIIPGSIDLAVNIHSFSECALPAIDWWLKLLVEKEIPYLMIVPNSGEELLNNHGQDFKPLLNRHGYQLTALEPKYQDPQLQKYALNPDHYHLYKLSS
jgi:hypothetical protein